METKLTDKESITIALEIIMREHVGGEPLSEELLEAIEFFKNFPHLQGNNPLDVVAQIELLKLGQKGKIFFLKRRAQ